MTDLGVMFGPKLSIESLHNLSVFIDSLYVLEKFFADVSPFKLLYHRCVRFKLKCACVLCLRYI